MDVDKYAKFMSYKHSPYPLGMKVKHGKIVETTESALFKYYLQREYDDIYSFTDFKEKMKDSGVKIK